jgi:hypothetical protein
MDQPTPQQIETYSLKFSKPEPFAGLNAIKADWLAEHGNSFVSWSNLNKQLKRLSCRVVDLMLSQFHANAKVFAEYVETVEKRLLESTRKIHELEKSLAEATRKVEALERAEEKTLADAFRGGWQPGTFYTRGGLTVWDGSLWLCMADSGEKPGSSESWRMITKRGKDAKP